MVRCVALLAVLLLNTPRSVGAETVPVHGRWSDRPSGKELSAKDV